MIKKILIGVDNSKYAEAAAKYGFHLAQTLDAQVGVVNIIEPMTTPLANNGADEILGTPLQGLGGANDVELYNIQTETSENILTQITKRFGSKSKVTQFTEYGSTGEGIIDCSKEFKADIIVIGTHDRSGLDRFLSGSIAEYVVRHSEIPVLVVPSV